MEQPLVSVVVVSYNQARYISQMLDSLKSQTYSNWELIVADDASPDDSVAIFKNWLNVNKVSATEIYHSVNTGLATVLNEATELCKGKYVKFIAADDYLHPDYLQKAVKCLEEKGSEYGMVFTDTFCIDENGSPEPDILDYSFLKNISSSKLNQEIIKLNIIAALTVLMRTDAVKQTGKYDSSFLVEDYYRWLKIGEKYEIAFVPEKLAYYRLHEENISKIKAERIGIEANMLRIMFDHKGIAKNKINDFIHGMYICKKVIPEDLFLLYIKYPFHSKMLKFCIRYDIPPTIFRIINKIFAKY